MRAVKAKRIRRDVRTVIQQSGEKLPERALARSPHGYIVNHPKSFRGLYRHVKKGKIILSA